MRKIIRKIHENRLYKKFHQFIRFGIVGVTNFLISLAVYYFVLWIFGNFPDGANSSNQMVFFLFRYDYETAQVTAYVISVLNAYILNRLWVFRKEAKKTSQGSVVRFFLSYGMTFFLSLFLAWFWVEILSVSKAVVPFLNVLITTPLNFLLSKYFAFREKTTHPDDAKLLAAPEVNPKEAAK